MRESHTPRSAVSRSRGMALLRDAPPNAKVGLVFEGDTADARGSRGVAVKHEAGIAFPTKRLKYLVSLRRSSNTRRDGARPYIGLEDIESRTGRLVDGDAVSGAGTTSSADDESRSSGNGFESGDVLFGKLRPYLAKAWVAEFPGRCTTEALVMAPHSIEPRFLRAVCLSSTFIHAVNASTFGSKMPRAEWDSIADIRVPTPDRERQIVIADYLDRETARLDALVAAKERFLKLLAEKRKALITRAVTRGLDPDAHTQDSSIAFPTKRLKYLVALRRSHDTEREEARPYIGLEKIESWTGRLVDNNAVSGHGTTPSTAGESKSLSNSFEIGDVLFGKLRPYLAKAWVAELPGRCTTEALVMDPHSIESRFLRYVCLSPAFIDAVDASASGSRMPRVEWDFIGNIQVPAPEWDEQRAIADHLDRETAQLDALMARVRQAIAFVEERRAALVTAAVAGRIDAGSTP